MTLTPPALRRSPAFAYMISGVLGGLTLLPVFGLQDADSFPISTYPMFAARRGQPKLYKLVAVSADGAMQPVPPALIGSSELLQAKALINHAVKKGPKALAALCERVARSVAADASLRATLELQIQELRYDPLTYFEMPAPRSAVKLLERCPVLPPPTSTP